MTMQLMNPGQGPITMSSREIAELCEKNHQHVLRDIEAMLQGLELAIEGYVQFWTHPQNGQQYRQIALPKDLTLTLISGYNVKLRKRIIDRWMVLEAAPRQPDLSDPVLLVQLLTEHASKRIEAERRADMAERAVEAVKPKLEAHDRIAAADGSLNITEAAKALQVRPKELFDFLARNGWTYKRPGSANWLGYQTHTSNGDLEHKVTTVLRPDGSEKVAEQVRITPKGLTKLAKLMPSRLLTVA